MSLLLICIYWCFCLTINPRVYSFIYMYFEYVHWFLKFYIFFQFLASFILASVYLLAFISFWQLLIFFPSLDRCALKGFLFSTSVLVLCSKNSIALGTEPLSWNCYTTDIQTVQHVCNSLLRTTKSRPVSYKIVLEKKRTWIPVYL